MSDELPPPRYEQRGNWKHLITDEREWLARPASWGIEYLPEPIQGRKRILFNYHFFPRLTRWVKCEPCRPLVASLFAEGGVTLPDWIPSTREGLHEWYDPLHPDGRCEAWGAFWSAVHLRMNAIVPQEFSNKLIDLLFGCRHHREFETRSSQLRDLCNQWDRELALELIGPNPFRPVAFDPIWRTEAVVGLARGMYEARDFGPMPVLADALEDAGCADADVLAHCRGPGPHVRGCWVVDLVLGKG
ncbi:MAG TPA: hypothetical protein VD866_28655 [Urbifossiella sp.]|nr:hypothetical protein [Urbifossiella sp.]